MVELRAAGDIVFVLESGVLDERATLAFVGGQCHGLALALHARTGLPLVAVFDPTPTCIHVCVREAGGLLIDITGATDEAEVVADGAHSIRAVDTAFVDALTAEHDWAPADTAVAEAWVGPVLDRIGRGEQLPPLCSATMRRTGPVDDELELRIEWTGEAQLDVHVRRLGDAEWTLYSYAAFPPDDDGLHRIDFTAERFNALTDAWVAREFDPAKARRRLSVAGR